MIPVLVAGAAIGLGTHAQASKNNDEARAKNRRANEIIDESSKIAQDAKNRCQNSIDALAKEKTRILQGNMRRFVDSFNQIYPVNYKDVEGFSEIAKFNKNELVTMQTMVSSVQKVSANDVVGGVSGAALAVGAADMIAGGSILGGAGISVGGLTGGAALGAVAAPIFAITGIFSASEASANLEKARSNLSKALVYQDECETYSYLAHAVSERCDMFYETLYIINENLFTDAVNKLEVLVNSKKSFGNSIRNIVGKKIYTHQEMKEVSKAFSLAEMVKRIIVTNILDSNGHVTDESEKVIVEIQDKMNNEDLTVRMPELEIQQPVYQQPLPLSQQTAYQQQVTYQQSKEKRQSVKEKGKSEGLFMSILSVLFGIISIISLGSFIIPEILGIVFACRGKRQGKLRGASKVGLSFSIISIVILLASVFSLFKTDNAESVDLEVARDNVVEISDQYASEHNNALQDAVTSKEDNVDANVSKDKLQDIENVTETKYSINDLNQDNADTDISNDESDFVEYGLDESWFEDGALYNVDDQSISLTFMAINYSQEPDAKVYIKENGWNHEYILYMEDERHGYLTYAEGRASIGSLSFTMDGVVVDCGIPDIDGTYWYKEDDVDANDLNQGEIDYSAWEGTYQRSNEPSSTITFHSLDYRGITFSASVGTPGDAAYVDIRECFAGWKDHPSKAFYGGDRGYLLFFTLNEDGSISVEDNYQPYLKGSSLAGEYTRESEVNYPDREFVFPDSANQYISYRECDGLTALECKIARNEIYARHGRKFTDESLQAYFDACSWYEGIIEVGDFTEDVLNEYELENLKIITEYEEKMGYR